jgi:predicted Zn-dependent protease
MKKFCIIFYVCFLFVLASNGQTSQLTKSKIQEIKIDWDKAVLLEKDGKLFEAEKVLKQLTVEHSEHAGVWYVLGLNLWKQKKSDEAIAAFKYSLSMESEKNGSNLYLGFTLMHQKKDYEAAIPYLKKASEFHIKDFKSRNLPLDAFNQHLAEALFGAKRFDEARIEYEKLVNLLPNNVFFITRLALCLNETNHLSESEELLKQKVENGIENYSIWKLYGDVLVKQGKTTESKEAYAKAKTFCSNCYTKDFN